MTQTFCEITEKKEIAPNVFSMWLRCDFTTPHGGGIKNAKPGQFLHILPENKALRRPISICEINGDLLRIIFEIRGAGTSEIADKNVGDLLDVLGACGNGFELLNNTTETDEIILAGGGIGVPPLLELAKIYGKKTTVFLGFRSRHNVILNEDFSKYTDKIHVFTEDGSFGNKGYFTEKMGEILAENKNVKMIYSCGPMAMLKSVSDIAKTVGVPCQISLEERMGCGVGACLCCPVKTKNGVKRVCKDGPVFNSEDVIF
jgi:dihydroorotate dehydrogenase electron transfer subunit